MAAAARNDLLLAVMGAPHGSEQTTTLLRLAQAVLERGSTVEVWTCGYATMLTHEALGERKPRNMVDWEGDYPSAAALVGELLSAYAGRLRWSACRFCSEERGVTAHIPEVRVRPPFKFGDHLAAAGKTIFIGTI
jgi:sulfur relay (sulfurtransferase) complex TusBCD TusD component (DsrE family)